MIYLLLILISLNETPFINKCKLFSNCRGKYKSAKIYLEQQVANVRNFFFQIHTLICPAFELLSLLPFLSWNILINRFATIIYSKPTSGQYLNWDSFSRTLRKIYHISILVHYPFLICSSCKLSSELDFRRSILASNYNSSDVSHW